MTLHNNASEAGRAGPSGVTDRDALTRHAQAVSMSDPSDTTQADSPRRTGGSAQLDAASVQTWASQVGHENSQWSTQTSNNSAQYRNPYAETVSEGDGDDSASVATMPTIATLDHEVPATTPSGDNGATPSFPMATPETGAQGTSHSPQPLGASPSTPSDGLFKEAATHPMYEYVDHRMTADPYTAQQALLNDVAFEHVVTTGQGAAVGFNGVEPHGKVTFRHMENSGVNCTVGISSKEVIIASRIPVPDPSSLAAATNQPAAPSSIPSHEASSSKFSWPLNCAQDHSCDPDGTEWWRVEQLVRIPPSTVPRGPIIRWEAYDSEAKERLSVVEQPVSLLWAPVYDSQITANDASAMSQTDP